MTDKIPSRDLQEDLLILLVFDDQHCNILANLVKPKHFNRTYEEIVKRTIEFIHTYKEAPKQSLPLLMDDLLSSDNKEEVKLYRQTMEYLFQSNRGVQAKYTLNRLESFIRSRAMKDGVLQAAEILSSSDSPEAMNRVERILLDASKERLSVFNPGTKLTSLDKSLSWLDKSDDDVFLTGVKHLDNRNAGPVRGGLFLFVAAAKAGKSWALTHLGKMALLQRQTVLHITLEMDESQVSMRYLQSWFGMSRREKVTDRAVLSLDDDGSFVGIDSRELVPHLTFQMTDIKQKLATKINRRSKRMEGLMIKQFPTGGLTINALNAYLDLLAESERVKPDLLIIDYADLMKVEGNDFRISLGNLYKQLRGIAVERNIAIVTASQANRSGARSRQVDVTDIAEDWSKIATSDIVITYSQSEAEKALNLARLRVAAARSDEDKYTVVIAQHYETGQFCLDSIRLVPRYFSMVGELGNLEVDDQEVEAND